MSNIKIGVIGFSDMKNPNLRNPEIYDSGVMTVIMFFQNRLRQKYGSDVKFELVGGLTDTGVNKYAYEYATNKFHNTGFVKTIGFSCSKASDYPCFPVDEKHLIGSEWGDESEAFLEYIDALVKIGGGEQSQKEWDMFTTKYPKKICYDASFTCSKEKE